MKKSGIILTLLFFAIVLKSNSQTSSPIDSYIGKWQITIIDTPSGDSKLIAEFVKLDGKLKCKLTGPDGTQIPTDEIIEETGKIIIGFEAQSMSISLTLEYADENNLKGSLMNGRFDAKGIRIKE